MEMVLALRDGSTDSRPLQSIWEAGSIHRTTPPQSARSSCQLPQRWSRGRFAPTGAQKISPAEDFLCGGFAGAPGGRTFSRVKVPKSPGSGKNFAKGKGVRREAESEESRILGVKRSLNGQNSGLTNRNCIQPGRFLFAAHRSSGKFCGDSGLFCVTKDDRMNDKAF